MLRFLEEEPLKNLGVYRDYGGMMWLPILKALFKTVSAFMGLCSHLSLGS